MEVLSIVDAFNKRNWANLTQFFTHERGKYMALYALALGWSNGIAPLITGFINDGLGYEWVFVSL